VAGMTSITVEFDTTALAGYTDGFLATLWHVAQENPADGFECKEPGEVVAAIGWEIIRRWLRNTEPAMYHHQDRHYYWKQLTKFAQCVDGEWVARTGPAGSAHGEPDLRED
jgi:hypothetical protein